MCDLGVLRETYQKADGKIGYRCASEPKEIYISKGGDPGATAGRKCICNSLCASAGIGQVRHGYHEPQIITIGDDVGCVRDLWVAARVTVRSEVIERLLA